MSPRKDRYRVPEHIVQEYRNQGKKLLRGPFLCLHCNQERLRIIISEEKKQVLAICKCGFREYIDYNSSNEAIDYYNKIIDNR